MRGKNIIWLTMAVMLISVAFVNINLAQEGVVVAAEPETTRNLLPGDYFDITITITNVVDLHAYGFVLHFAPFTSVLNIYAVDEGDFLSEGAPPDVNTWFVYSVDTFDGKLTVGCTRHKDLPGISGSGTLVIVHFQVVEAGSSPLDLEEVKLYNTALEPIPCTTLNAEYVGIYATGKHPNGQITKNKWKVGDLAEFKMSAKNTADVPLYVKARFTFQREDGEAAYIWTGQSYTGFGPNTVDMAYVDGFYPFWTDWNTAGPPEALIGPPDGSYIRSEGDCMFQGMYTFGDIDTQGRVVENVDFFAYSRCSATGPDIDSYISWDGGYQFAWGDSQGGTLDWAWTKKWYYWPAYNFPEYYGFPLEQPAVQSAVDSAELAIHNYAGGWMEVDAYQMRVTYSKYTPAQGDEASYVVMPGETIDLPPATWPLSSFDTGVYYGSVTLHYSFGGEWFIRSHNPPAFNFVFVVEP